MKPARKKAVHFGIVMVRASKGVLPNFANAVRKAGMKFGFWLEAEIAEAGTEIVRKHPEYFREIRGGHYLDFTRDDARGYLLETVC